MKTKSNPNGAILYSGPSLLDGTPIVVIATGLQASTANAKTGNMIQTWILRQDVDPFAALKTGEDTAVCGDCRHRSVASGGSGACYVRVYQAPLSVWRGWKRGIYRDATTGDHGIGAGRRVRLGSYGDPAAVPVEVWQRLLAGSTGHTGYTHQWKTAEDLKPYAMASVDTPAEAAEATAQGWKYFRVTRESARLLGEARCPASAESGHKRTCETCPLQCAGTSGARSSIVIMAHGALARRFTGV